MLSEMEVKRATAKGIRERSHGIEPEIEKQLLIKNYLCDPNIFNEITEQELGKKIVGEIPTRKVIFLCSAGGRLVINSKIASFNLLVNDDSGTGKDHVTSSVLQILPKEDYIHKTRISPTVFTYWHNPQVEPDWTWDGKVFYNEDISEAVLNSEVIKCMSSVGSKATITVKQKAVDIDVAGKPVMIVTTATATPNPELTRRFVILNLDSSENQTKSIMKHASKLKKEGITPEYDPDFTNALRYLKRVKVKIPFADIIDEHFPTNNIIMRTNYDRFLDFICASAGFHQYQRDVDKDGFVIATGFDYDLARECFNKITSNPYMIPLSINQKKIIEVFRNAKNLKGSVAKLHSVMNFITDRALQTNLGTLAKYGLLETDIEKDTWNRDIDVYSISKNFKINEQFYIPIFEELSRNTSIPTVLTIPSLPSEPTIPKEKVIGTEAMEGSEAQKCYIKPAKRYANDLTVEDWKNILGGGDGS